MLVTAIIIFLFLSALFSGTEIAFISANKLKIELKKKKSAGRGAILARFYEKPASFLSTLLVGNNIALVAFTSLMTIPLNHFFIEIVGLTNEGLLLLINTIAITIIILIFGEFLPKTIFRLYADEMLYFLVYPIKVIQVLLLIPAWVMTKSSNLFLRLFFKNTGEVDEVTFTRLDLENFIRESRTVTDDAIDKTLFGKALNLKEIKVRECMVPRLEIESIDVSASVAELEDLFRESGLSRIIVTKGDIDNVLGYVHHQYLLKQPETIESVILDVPFVPEVMRVTDLMNKFIKERNYIAVVFDEFGGVSGIITLEDILEEIFGEIEDEHDEEEYVETQISENEFLFSGRLEIDYLNEKYGLHFPEGEYHTLSGYLVMTVETIPEQGAEIEMNGYKFILELVSDTKVETIRVIRMDQGESI
jgi:putative hemolysin